MGWIANALLLIGFWLIGKKYRIAFLFTFAGEVLWVITCIARETSLDMIAICLVFAVLALRNFILWGKQ